MRDFEAAIRAGDPASLQRAVDLYWGPPLEDGREEWLFPERRAREAYLAALERVELLREAGEPRSLALALPFLAAQCSVTGDRAARSLYHEMVDVARASGPIPTG